MRNIALLFVGRSNNFPIVGKKIIKAFENTEHNIYYFGHTWNDDFIPLDRSDDIFTFRKKLFNVDAELIKKTIKFDGFETSSYNEMLDVIEDVEFKLPRLKTMFLTYVSQFYSLAHASNMAYKFAKQNSIKYDAVIKWRYDLVAEKVNLSFDEVTENVLYVDNFGSSIGINDQYFYGSHETMKSICTEYKKFMSLFIESVYYVYNSDHTTDEIKKLVETDKIMFSEKMFKDMCKSLIPTIEFNSNPNNLIETCLFKDGCDPNWNIQQLKNYIETEWNGQGWDNRILTAQTTIGPVIGKIKL